jgi:hypothetical protein
MTSGDRFAQLSNLRRMVSPASRRRGETLFLRWSSAAPAVSVGCWSPDIYVRGKATYKANLNPDSPQGTIASIDSVLRSLDSRAEEEQQEIDRKQKALAGLPGAAGEALRARGAIEGTDGEAGSA